ncbi:MAG: hypothetical protein Athens071424_182 [Parcubacteria group bacterium Athens0714_24]|nr:MAG: hypothetical protein Athens071424_182 [Parcubacteria group bacterium Athens0714_24]
MTGFIILIFLIIISALGIFYLLTGRIKGILPLSEEDILLKIRAMRSVSSDLHDYIIVPTSAFWKNVVLPKIYKDFEKMISRFRINILKIECWLLKLTNYIRGKREIQCNGNTEYWKEINESKNGNKNGNTAEK